MLRKWKALRLKTMPARNGPIVKKIREEAKKKVKKAGSNRKYLNSLDELEENAKRKGIVIEDSKLNLKQIRFCQEYCRNDGHATNAALFAGYSEKTAYKHGSDLLKKRDIKEKVLEIEDQHCAAAELTVEYKYKSFKRAADILNQLLEDDPTAMSKSLVAVLAEASKMAGHYAPDRTITKNLHALTQDEDIVEDLVSEYEKDY